jgi:hypothetical protein
MSNISYALTVMSSWSPSFQFTDNEVDSLGTSLVLTNVASGGIP